MTPLPTLSQTQREIPFDRPAFRSVKNTADCRRTSLAEIRWESDTRKYFKLAFPPTPLPKRFFHRHFSFSLHRFFIAPGYNGSPKLLKFFSSPDHGDCPLLFTRSGQPVQAAMAIDHADVWRALDKAANHRTYAQLEIDEMSMQEEIVSALDSPKDLELIYRKSPAEFTKTFPKVFSQYPDSITLKIWHERLFFQSFFNSTSNKNNDILGKKDIILTVILSLTAGTLMKIPDLIKGIDESFFYIRESSFIVFISLAAYFLIQNNSSFKTTGTTLALFATSLIYINILPHDSNSQTLILSCLHMPFFLWSLLGISFVSGRYGDFTGRMNYIRYNGELLIFTIMILIGGAILIGVTAGLFKIISINIGRLYMSNIVVYGLVAAPIVSTLIIDKISGNRFKIAPILAKIFTPLFLVTTIVYLVAMIIQGESPYTSRDFLIIFNILLLIVLCLSVFSISDRGSNQEKTAGDFMNIALVTVTLIIDLVALSAILFRLSSFGFTPNRIAVLGANILVFGHLCGIALHYIRFFKGSSAFSSLEHWIAGYLPAYTAWTTIVAFGFPVMFWFK